MYFLLKQESSPWKLSGPPFSQSKSSLSTKCSYSVNMVTARLISSLNDSCNKLAVCYFLVELGSCWRLKSESKYMLHMYWERSLPCLKMRKNSLKSSGNIIKLRGELKLNLSIICLNSPAVLKMLISRYVSNFTISSEKNASLCRYFFTNSSMLKLFSISI